MLECIRRGEVKGRACGVLDWGTVSWVTGGTVGCRVYTVPTVEVWTLAGDVGEMLFSNDF